ncbi:MAG: hypothetical protein QOI80_2690 [Solirubrobacteraceae bacterium]|nr:hypothetical protein [Solirubrobacteraceae bacterium]
MASETGPEDQRGRGVLSNTLFGLLTQVTTAVFTTVLTLYLVRALGPDDFGLFSLALSIAIVTLMVADFGVAYSAGRYVAERIDDLPYVRRVTDAALGLKLAGAAAVTAIGVLVAPLIADAYGEDGLTWPLRGAILSVGFESLMMLYQSAFGALRRTALSAPMVFLESLTEAAASIALVLLGAGVTGATFGRAAGYAVGTAVGVVLLARVVGRPRLHRRDRDRDLGREIARYARPLLLVNGAYTLYAYVDALLIGALLRARDVGEFTAPLRLIALVSYLGQAVANAVSPRLAGETPDVASFMRSLRFLLLAQGLLVVPLLAWSHPLVDLLLGDDYRVAGDVLLALTPYTFLMGVSPLITQTVTFIGGASRRVPIVLGALAINVVIDLALLPTIGVVGAAVGTGVALAVYVPAHLRICTRELALDLGPAAWTLARTVVAAEAATAALLAIGRHDLAAWQYAAGAVAAPVAYVAALLITGELTRGERARVAAFLRRR